MNPNKVLLAELTRDDRLRFRDTYSASLRETAETYAEAMAEANGWAEFPPIQAVRLTEAYSWAEEVPDPNGGRFAKLIQVKKTHAAGTLLLVEGFTRCEAADIAGLVAAPADVRPGTWCEAMRMAWAANSRHGRQRTREELHRVLESIVANPLYRTASGSVLAKLAGTSCATAKRWKQRRQEQITAPAPVIATASSEGVSPLVDTAVPERLRALFAGLPAARRIVARFKTDGTKLTRLVAGADAIGPAVEELMRAAELVEALLPGVVCVDCDGSGQSCPTCAGRGWLSDPPARKLTA